MMRPQFSMAPAEKSGTAIMSEETTRTRLCNNVGLYTGGMNIHDPEHGTSLHPLGMRLSSVLGTWRLVLICKNVVSYVVLFLKV